MTPAALRLLRAFIGRTAWLYSGAGLLQFLVTDFHWKGGFSRISVPAALLGLWAVAVAINTHNLVWRSLPLTARDASVFRWWAIAGAPGIWLTLCDSIAWASQRTSPGVSPPPMSALLLSILLGWAAIGAIALLPSLRRMLPGLIASRIITVLTVVYALWLLYGPPVTIVPWGLVLLIFSAVEAARGKLWWWPDAENSGAGSARRSAERSIEPRFGASVILFPLLRQTLFFAIAATGGVVLLYRFFPGAGAWLFWSYFLVISSTGFLLTYRVRSAIPILRILPMSARQLAVRLQLFGALPGIVTLCMALLLNATVLHLQLDPLEFATFALIVIAIQALPIRESPRARMSAALLKWIRTLQRLFMPYYVGVFVLSYAGVWALWWFRLPIIASAMVLYFVGYYTLVQQLRAGPRPSSNEGAFSAT